MNTIVSTDEQLLIRLSSQLRELGHDYNDQNFTVRGIWTFNLRYQPNPRERLFRHEVLLCQSIGEGICYLKTPIDVPDSLLGTDAREIDKHPFEVQLSVLDSAFGGIRPDYTRHYTISGGHNKKAMDRASIVAETADLVLKKKTRSSGKSRVLNIGAIGLIIEQLMKRGYEVTATDLDPEIVGSNINGTKILSGSQNLEIISDHDLIIASGMAFATQTLVPIANQCKKFDIPCIVVAETAANLAPYYRNILGLAAVVSEPFPFYTFSSISEIFTYIE